MQKIFIVEDDRKLCEQLEIFLTRNGYQAQSLQNFEHPAQDVLKSRPDLLLIDINLPNVDGEYLVKEIRKASDLPIIMVTSRDSEVDELLCLHYGADQYVTKPFNIQILLAKISSLLKRAGGESPKETIDAGDFILHLANDRVERDGNSVELTKNEFKILKYLTEHRGRIVSREDIMDRLWETDSFIDDNTLSVNINRLRSKLEQLDLKELIETKRGQGYLLREEAQS